MTSLSETQNSLKGIPKGREILDNINLNAPRNAYTFFCMEEAEKLKYKNIEINGNIGKFSRTCGEAWAELDHKSKQKYYRMSENEKKRI